MILNFYIQGHIGDVVVAKPFCKEIINILKPEKVLFSCCYESLPAKDICLERGAHMEQKDVYRFTFKRADTLFINMFLLTIGHEIPNLKLLSHNDSYCMFDYMLSNYNYFLKEELDVDISYMAKDPQKYFWVIDKEQFPIYKNIPVDKNCRKRVLIYNQKANSGQMKNENMREFLYPLVNRHKDIIFYLTSRIDLDGVDLATFENVVFITDFYKDIPELMGNKNDILETACFSESCDIIMGSVSGNFMSTWTAPNLLNPNKHFISISVQRYGSTMWHKSQKAINNRVKTIKEAYSKLEELL